MRINIYLGKKLTNTYNIYLGKTIKHQGAPPCSLVLTSLGHLLSARCSDRNNNLTAVKNE